MTRKEVGAVALLLSGAGALLLGPALQGGHPAQVALAALGVGLIGFVLGALGAGER